jgi:hypothetical protein
MFTNPQDEFFKVKGQKGSINVSTVMRSVKEFRDLDENGKLRLDYYQREYVYNSKKFEKASKVIETVLFGKVLPAIIFRENDDNGSLEIIDGQQRVTSLLKFINNEYPLNFKESDDGSMLNGLMFKDFNPELKSLILNYKLTGIKVVTENQEIVAELFLDLNYQPIAVTSNEITTSIVYGSIAKKAKELSKANSTGRLVDFPQLWYIFGHQTKYRKDGSFTVPAKDKGGSISLEVLKTMLSFIDKSTITLEKDRNWIRKKLIKSKMSDLSDYGLDRFEEMTQLINSVFKDELLGVEKSESPLFYKPVGKTRVSFIQPLADILYLTLYEFNTLQIESVKEGFKEEFYRAKSLLIDSLDSEERVLEIFKSFKTSVENLVKEVK